MKKTLSLFGIVMLAGFWRVAAAQPATAAQMAGVTPNSKYSTMHFQTRIGSFRVVDAQGRLEVTFKGTLLISQLKGTAVPSGNLRKEYPRPTDKNDHGKTVYFGEGKIVITGSWRGVQWFGTEMNAVWYGAGLVRLSGEFDENLNTGLYWFSNPTKKYPWVTAGTQTITLPSVQDVPDIKPVERGSVPPPSKPSKSGG